MECEGGRKWAESLASASRVSAHAQHDSDDGRRLLERYVTGSSHGGAETEGEKVKASGSGEEDGSHRQSGWCAVTPGGKPPKSKREALEGGRTSATLSNERRRC